MRMETDAMRGGHVVVDGEEVVVVRGALAIAEGVGVVDDNATFRSGCHTARIP